MSNTLFFIWVKFEEKWFRSCKSSDFYFLFVFKFENLSAKCFWNLLNVFMCLSCQKNTLELVFCKISRFFPKLNFFSQVWSIKVNPQLIKKAQFLGQNSLPSSVKARSIEIFQTYLSIDAQFLSTNQNSKISNS